MTSQLHFFEGRLSKKKQTLTTERLLVKILLSLDNDDKTGFGGLVVSVVAWQSSKTASCVTPGSNPAGGDLRINMLSILIVFIIFIGISWYKTVNIHFIMT